VVILIDNGLNVLFARVFFFAFIIGAVDADSCMNGLAVYSVYSGKALITRGCCVKPICNILFVYRDIGSHKRMSNSEYREIE